MIATRGTIKETPRKPPSIKDMNNFVALRLERGGREIKSLFHHEYPKSTKKNKQF
jgi:hypothetical protein